ncbi:MAG: HDOD domain-containing protein [bacterium]|nr:HDOD domain-containing protein [bacterium]
MMGKIDTTELLTKFNNNEEFSIPFKYPDDDILMQINSLMSKILSRTDLIFLQDTMLTILRETILNAVKANAKRIYFDRLGLDIHESSAYEQGMKKFKTDIVNDLHTIRDDLLGSFYKISIKFLKQKDGIKLTIKNNIKILPLELERITHRVETAKKCSNFSEAYKEVYDPSEGAGLGIILTILLIKNAGMDVEEFRVIGDEHSLSISLLIPFKLRTVETISTIKDKIIEEVDSLPTFPENIIELQTLCSDSHASIDVISSKIVLDPSLTADVLKIANSAGFITAKRIENINEAVMVIGLENLNSILAASASRKILDQRYKKFGQVWDHCNRVAFYSRYIAMNLGYNGLANNVFLASILHDIGKIVLLSTDITLVNHISDIIKNRKLRTSTILEEITIGISHSTIGALIAQKWNFPDFIIESIKDHHSPLSSGKKHRDTIFIVYFANMLTQIEKQKYTMSFIESEVLEEFNLNNNNSFEKFHKKLQEKYNNHFSIV